MDSTDKDKLKHDFLNAIVVINCMTKSASSFMNTISQSTNIGDTNQMQMEKFLYAMKAIREQSAKIENYFLSVLNE